MARCRVLVVSSVVVAAMPCGRASADLGEVIEQLDRITTAVFGEDTMSTDPDVNGDRRVTAADLTAALGTAFATPTPSATGTATPVPPPTVSATPTASATKTPGGPLFDGAITDLVPHAVNDSLIYQITDPTGITTEHGIVISSQLGGSFVIDVVNGTAHQTQTYVDSGTQLGYVGTTNVVTGVRTTCTPALLRLSMPVIAGQISSTTSQCELRTVVGNVYLGAFQRTDTFVPVDVLESRTVPAGTYTQVIHLTGSTSLGAETSEHYLVPGIGLIEERRTSAGNTTVRALLDGTIGGHSVKP